MANHTNGVPVKPKTPVTPVQIETALRFVYSRFLSLTNQTYFNKGSFKPRQYTRMIFTQSGDTLELIDTLEEAVEQWADMHQAKNQDEAAEVEAILHEQVTIIKSAIRECSRFRGTKRCRTANYRTPTVKEHPAANIRHRADVPEHLLPDWHPGKKRKKTVKK